MKRSLRLLLPAIGLTLVFCAGVQAEQHRATRLGNPATRFAPPLKTPEDLRSRFRDEKLKADMASVLQQWGWTGNRQDLYQAALSAEIADVRIPIGATMPFMSSREGGKAICLRNVIWAGQEPAPAYAFQFTSKGQRYRCVTPKACSNFFLEDLGPEPKPALALNCTAPAEVPAGRPVEVCLTVSNTGDAAEGKTIVTLPIPEASTVARTTENGVSSGTEVTWELPSLPAGATRQVCAFFGLREPGMLSFNATARGLRPDSVKTACSTKVIGIPAILLELADLEDPIEVGHEVTYEIKVTNQGSAAGTNIRLVCRLPESEEYVSSTGATAVRAEQRVITTDALPELAPKAAVSWRVVVRATRAADARFKLQLTSDQFQRPIDEEESTELY
jgi:uncharacterized repeat protein (TIGR01451 family)